MNIGTMTYLNNEIHAYLRIGMRTSNIIITVSIPIAKALYPAIDFLVAVFIISYNYHNPLILSNFFTGVFTLLMLKL